LRERCRSRFGESSGHRTTDLNASARERTVRCRRGSWSTWPVRFDRDPVGFAADADDEAGRTWIASLPARLDELTDRWRLEVEEGLPRHGFNAFVLPVRREGEPCILKLVWPHEAAVDEATALRVWDGNGAVKLLAAETDVGALLLERLDARSLADQPLLEAAELAGRLLRRLAVPAPHGFRTTAEVASEWLDSMGGARQEASPVPDRFIDRAVVAARSLTTSEERSLVHADLHYGNVLSSAREEWLAIDPKPLVGDPEIALAELLWTRLDEVSDGPGVMEVFDALIQGGRLDPERATAWAIVRCVDYWRWGVEHDLTEDPRRCRRILEAFA
jgi:streptomycin 6-kinase